MGGIDRAEPPVGIERFGEIQADLAAGVPRGDVLAGGRLTDAQLLAVTDHWLAAMAQEVRRGRTALAQRYARAYIARRPDLLRDPEADVDRLAALAAASAPPAAPAAAGGAPARPKGNGAPPEAPGPPSEATPRFVPSYLLDEAAKSQRAPAAPAPVPVAAAPAAPPVAAQPPLPEVRTAPLVVAPSPIILDPGSTPARPAANKLKGTMMAMEIPASFKAIPFSSEPTPPPSSRAAAPPSTVGTPPGPAVRSSHAGPSRPAITGTAAFELPEHLRNIPLSGPPKAPPPPAPPPPPGLPPRSASPSPHLSATAPLPSPAQPAARQPAPATPQLPSLEEYVRLGVELGTTPPDRVDAVLAAARWTRSTWATVDQTYRSRLAREPALQLAFQAALAAERARRAGAPR